MSQTPSRETRRKALGGPDPLDLRLGTPDGPSPLTWLLSLLRTRSALGFDPSVTPAVLYLPVGVLLGPGVLNVLSPAMLDQFDAVVPVALAVLGVMVGVTVARDLKPVMRLFAAASVESLATMGVVAGASAFFISRTGLPVDTPLLAFSLALGLCASTSAATSADPDSESVASVAARIADFDDVLPILLGIAVFSVLPLSPGEHVFTLIAAPLLLGLVVGAIGLLLFERAESGPERVLFVIGSLALAGGSAAYLHVSPLAVGLVGGFIWTVAPGRADRIVADDLRRVQHPLVVMLLITAGALTGFSRAALWLLAPYLLCRLAGKVVGAWGAARLSEVRPADLASYLMSPGVLAIAFALNFRQILSPTAGDTLLSTVAIGTAAFEVFALAVVPNWRRSATP